MARCWAQVVATAQPTAACLHTDNHCVQVVTHCEGKCNVIRPTVHTLHVMQCHSLISVSIRVAC